MAALLPFRRDRWRRCWCQFGVVLTTGAWHRGGWRRWTVGFVRGACEASGGWAGFDDVDQAIDSVYRHLLLCSAGQVTLIDLTVV